MKSPTRKHPVSKGSKANASFRAKLVRQLTEKFGALKAHLIMPYFVVEGKGVRNPVRSMPGVSQFSVDLLLKEVARAKKIGVSSVLIFGIPDEKDLLATRAYAADGIVQKAVAAIKQNIPGMFVITDVCLCHYTSHGHCGVLKHVEKAAASKKMAFDHVDHKRTLQLLAEVAVSHACAGADMVAPSAMMKGQVAAIRAVLDAADFGKTPIMGYSAKFASSFYGPFRDAAGSAPKFGDRSSYQLDSACCQTAIDRVQADIREGADIVMVKPALAYLDVIREVKACCRIPVAAYNVSGEYAMVKAAAKAGWIDEKKVTAEILLGMRRAGADMVITYHACDVMKWMKGKS